MESITAIQTSAEHNEQSESTINSVPMSFPAILRSAKLADRFAYLRETSVAGNGGSQTLISSKKRSRDEREGKRWIRRRENAHFTNNPFVVQAGTQDIQIVPPSTRRTFPEPLPSYLPRSVSAPAAIRPVFDPASANMGRYSMSVKGMRRTLRGLGPRAQILVRDVEKEIKDWLAGGTILLPDEAEGVLIIHGRPIGSTLTIVELSRTPLQLIWSVEQDAFARYVVHCCARYHKVVSYSKDVDGRRLTFLLRPNVTRSDYAARNILDTPPATAGETDSSLGVLSESDILSVEENEPVPDIVSDTEVSGRGARHRRLSSVSERENESEVNDTPRATRLRPPPEREEPAEFADDDESVNGDLAQSVDSLDLNPIAREPPIRYTSQLVERTPLRDRRGVSRTSSSPSHSRSPCPPSRRLRKGRTRLVKRTSRDPNQSFYDFLYS
ncbi:hypothetical protein ACEPAI_7916 [Sanghuangporus weigelae]